MSSSLPFHHCLSMAFDQKPLPTHWLLGHLNKMSLSIQLLVPCWLSDAVCRVAGKADRYTKNKSGCWQEWSTDSWGQETQAVLAGSRMIPVLERRVGSVSMEHVCLHTAVHACHVPSINTALGDTCSLHRQEHRGKVE